MPDPAPEDRPVLVVDLGGQYSQLIARRVRELNVYSELLPHDTPWAEIVRRRPKAIILSGGPNSVYDVAPTILHLYGIEQPKQMRGHVLSVIFENSPNKVAQK